MYAKGGDATLTPSEIGKAMRAIPSAKRDEAIKRNLALGHERVRQYNASRVLKPCTCHTEPLDGKHESSCPVYMRLKQRDKRAKDKR